MYSLALAQLLYIGGGSFVNRGAWAPLASQFCELGGAFDGEKASVGMQTLGDTLGENTRARPILDNTSYFAPIEPIDHHVDQPRAARRYGPDRRGVASKIL